MLLWTVLAALGLQLAGVYLPPLQELLSTEALDLTELLVTLVAVPVGYLAIRLERRAEREHQG